MNETDSLSWVSGTRFAAVYDRHSPAWKPENTCPVVDLEVKAQDINLVGMPSRRSPRRRPASAADQYHPAAEEAQEQAVDQAVGIYPLASAQVNGAGRKP